MPEMQYDMKNEISTSSKESRRRTLPVACSFIVIHALLLFFSAKIPSQEFLFLYFFSSLVVLPGCIAAGILFPAARCYFKLFLSILLGMIPAFVLLLISSVAGFDIFHILWMVPVITIGLAIYHDYGRYSGYELDGNQALTRSSLALLIVILVLVSIITLGVRDPITYTADSPDHIAYIRAVTRSHEAFPSQFIYRDGGMLTRDIRRGLLHAMWGAINGATSRTDVLPVWPLISWIGSIFLLLGIFCMGVWLFKSQSVGWGGVILYLLFYQRGFAGHQLFINAYSFYFAKIHLFAFLTFAILYIRTKRSVHLFTAAAASFVAISIHVSYIAILLFIVFVLWIMEHLQRGRRSAKGLLTETLLPLAGSLVLVNLPYLLIRYVRDYNPVNEIHTHPHGMLFFTDNLAIVNPILFFLLSGHLMAVALFAVFILWKESRDDRNLRSVLGLVASIYILVFNPLLVPIVMERITYLIARFSVAAPNMLIASYLMHLLIVDIFRRGNSLSRTRKVVGSLVMLAILIPGLVYNIDSFAYGGRGRRAYEEKSCLELNDLYSAINRNVEDGSVIASDPITSYSILAFTDQFVVCTYDQHSTPNDSTAVERIFDCRDLFLPNATCGERIGTLEKYDADYVIVNGRIPKEVRSQYWRPDRTSAERTARALSECEGYFQTIYSSESVYLFEYNGETAGASTDTIDVDRYSAHIFREEFSGDYGSLTESGTEGIYIRSWGKEADRVSRGDTLRIYVDWVARESMERGTYIIYVRFDTDYEKGSLHNARYEKVYRKIVERIRGETYRFREDFLPFEGIYPPDRWRPGRVLRDYIDIVIPRYIADGIYTISVKMDNAPHYSNLRMKDLLRDDDLYDGPDLMQVEIE